jgi:hypothetical protein
MKRGNPEMPANHSISPDVRAAIAAFLNDCQNETRPFAMREAMGAIRALFPDLDISDAALEDALSSAAAAAGFDITYSHDGPAKVKRTELERWDNEGGAVGKVPRAEAQRRIDNDTKRRRRRDRDTAERHRLI